uniref:Small Terminase n=1 Tax=Myoviridae sp. ctMvU7 TaxID=2826642 RepID=A0A8S5M7L9_9CAUD|nr:MAG TPA: Small Terminase [Myoviridae sp. ctMvU7]
MARAPDPRIEQAKAMYLEGQKLVEIASQLNLPEGTVRRWKCTHKWDNERSDKKSERSQKRKRGAQPKNQNAIGNNGGAPENNKNAVTTGEFETLLFDCLDPEEQRLAQAVPEDKQKLLMQEIQLLTVRERRMLKRINLLRMSLDDSGASSGDETGLTVVSHKSGLEKDKETDLLEYRGKLGQIQNIEDALTRVQARKQAAIDALHRYGVDDARLEIEMMKLDLAALKLGGQEQQIEDDGFLDALNTESRSLWGDADDD